MDKGHHRRVSVEHAVRPRRHRLVLMAAMQEIPVLLRAHSIAFIITDFATMFPAVLFQRPLFLLIDFPIPRDHGAETAEHAHRET